jgi:hypothetical protein
LSMSCVLVTCGFWVCWCSSAESTIIVLCSKYHIFCFYGFFAQSALRKHIMVRFVGMFYWWSFISVITEFPFHLYHYKSCFIWSSEFSKEVIIHDMIFRSKKNLSDWCTDYSLQQSYPLCWHN